MRVREQLIAKRRVPELRAPDLRVAHEETLIARVAANHGRFLSIERDAVRAVRLHQPGVVANVLTHRETWIDVQVVDRADRRVLGAELLRTVLERGGIAGRPPVPKIAGAVGLGALIVEAVTDLVTDH